MARRRAEALNTDSIGEQGQKQDRRRRPKIIVSLREDGSPDLDGLTPEAQDKLRAALEQVAPEPPPPLDPAIVGFALMAVARIEAAVVGPRFGLSAEQAADCIVPQGPLRSQLNAAAARVLDKYSGTWCKWQDEIVLAALLVSWQASAIQALRAERERAERERAVETARAASPAPTPVRVDGDGQNYQVMTETVEAD